MILLIRPPDGGQHPTGYTKVEALGVEYVASVLRQGGHEITYLDFELCPEHVRAFASTLSHLRPDIVGIALNYPQAEAKLAGILALIRQAVPGAAVLAGGQYATVAWHDVLSNHPEVDCILRFEAEPFICDVVEALAQHSDLSGLPNLAYRRGGRIVSNSLGSRPKDLDALPFPLRSPELLAEMRRGARSASVAASRGCWWAKCAYCAIASSFVDSRWVGRSPANLVDEVEFLVNSHGIRQFTFVDADFLGPPRSSLRRATDFSAELSARSLKISYSINTRPDNVTAASMHALLDSGLSLVFLGIESGSASQLQRWRRGTSVTRTEEAIHILDEAKIPFRAGFIMFDPESTLKDIAQNIAFLKRFPVIEPSLLIRGLEFRIGTPIHERLAPKSDPRNSDTYFANADVATFVRVCRECFGRPLLWLHRIPGDLDKHPRVAASTSSTGKRLLEQAVLIVLLDAMQEAISWSTGSRGVMSRDTERQFCMELEEVIDRRILRLLDSEAHPVSSKGIHEYRD